MIRATQRRLTAVLLSFLAVLYTGICAANYLSLRSNLKRSSLEMLRRIAQDAGPRGPFDGAAPAPIPYFTLQLSAQGELLAVQSGQFDLTDRDALSVAAAVLNAPGESGYLAQYRLSYVRFPKREGWRVVCADDTLRCGALSHQLRASALLGAALLPVFWLLSRLLARLLLRPARRAWEQQAQFVADASHELKTPLTVILANTDMILSDCALDDTGLARRAGNIRTEGERMRTLVLDLLSLARGDEGGRQEEAPAAVLWSEAVESSCLAFDALVYERGLRLRCLIQPECTVSGHEEALRRLPAILLDNAVKYCTPGGEISVQLHQEKDRWAVLTVSNPSAPLSPEQTQRLFDRFYRTDEARSGQKGYGLGLSVARQIVQGCGGRIRCDYREGEAVFTVRLPLVRRKM